MKKTTIILVIIMLFALNGCTQNNQNRTSNPTVTPPVATLPGVTPTDITPPGTAINIATPQTVIPPVPAPQAVIPAIPVATHPETTKPTINQQKTVTNISSNNSAQTTGNNFALYTTKDLTNLVGEVPDGTQVKVTGTIADANTVKEHCPIDFYIKDDSGYIRLVKRGSEIKNSIGKKVIISGAYTWNICEGLCECGPQISVSEISEME